MWNGLVGGWWVVFQARCWVSEGSGAPATVMAPFVGVVVGGVGGWCLGAFFGSPRAHVGGVWCWWAGCL